MLSHLFNNFINYINLFHCWFFSEKSLKVWEAVIFLVTVTSFYKVVILVFKTKILLLSINTVGLFSLNCILLIMLLQLSWFFSLYPPPPSTPHSLRQSPHHCSCLWVKCISSLSTPFPLLYFTSLWLFCSYLFLLLNPLILSLIRTHPPPIRQLIKYSLYSWFCLCSSCLLSLFFRFNCW